MKKILQVGAPVTLAAGTAVVSALLYQYAFRRADQSAEETPLPPDSPYYAADQWFLQAPKEKWQLNPDDPSQQIQAFYLPAARPSKKAVIMSHGYKGQARKMAASAQLFWADGYNVLMPDNRSHGGSAGKYINFGLLDRMDYLDWINKVIARLGPDCEIVLFGISMGGATVMMVSGEELPPQVKAIIEDCGYSSVEEELTYQMRSQFHLPKWPFWPIVSGINRITMGWSLADSVTSIGQLKKNTRPIFFIHGAEDKFVPTYMCIDCFNATHAPKDMWIVPGADHASSFATAPSEYTARVKRFLSQYVPSETSAS
ncbi:alpha/beta hydrolase [Schleiferilactobacillus shenzhenensis]|uniref:Serine aminopeptidase S33 domain-containing protein n=1 Tax=Schleiferilactobacillus shenzhenensis LY-73 TaxID=1231336 RepID=U4TJI0_9LACO|nr:alpha/beta hydrolase [Schleiferilactobacillus shenzhenensis]ERL64354.1 hypothetical protein L248_1016 [Schleiferilactobacillus shenzhenensis LY-73]